MLVYLALYVVRKIFYKPSASLLSPILTTHRWYRRGCDALQTCERKKNFQPLLTEFFSPPNNCESRAPTSRPNRESERREEGWKTWKVRQTKVEWPFVKLLGRKREIGCNPCAANRKCRTKYIRPFLILFRTYIRVSLSPLFLLLLSFPPFKFPRHPAFSLSRFHFSAHRKSLPRRQLSAGGTADWLRRKRVISSVIRKALWLKGAFGIHGIRVSVLHSLMLP